jgi:hypothetical protein
VQERWLFIHCPFVFNLKWKGKGEKKLNKELFKKRFHTIIGDKFYLNVDNYKKKQDFFALLNPK